MILYTSGTSANPKGCLLSHEAVVREASNLGRNRWEFDENDRIWSPMPLFHIAALLAALAALEVGGSFYGQPHFEPGSRSEEHTSELQSLMRISYAVFCLKKKKTKLKTINK